VAGDRVRDGRHHRPADGRTGLVELDGWRSGSRLIARRERPQREEQLKLFADYGEWRLVCSFCRRLHITNSSSVGSYGNRLRFFELMGLRKRSTRNLQRKPAKY